MGLSYRLIQLLSDGKSDSLGKQISLSLHAWLYSKYICVYKPQIGNAPDVVAWCEPLKRQYEGSLKSRVSSFNVPDAPYKKYETTNAFSIEYNLLGSK